MSVLTTIPKFLYPCSRQFPFDEVAEQIVRALERRNWKVPGITVEFYIYGSGEAKYKIVNCIIGDNFKLNFCRVQNEFDNGLNDIAALSTIHIPKEFIEVYGDESGPTYFLYVGNNWKADKNCFLNCSLYNNPIKYLKYNGCSFNKKRAEYLVATSNPRCKYLHRNNKPARINLEEKFNDFTAWLKEFVLDYILSFPEADIILPSSTTEELIPYKGPWPTIFTVCDWKNERKITIGKEVPNSLPPRERFAMSSNYSILPLSIPNKGKFPEIAYKSFIACDVKYVDEPSEFLCEIMNCFWCTSQPNYLVCVKLKYANHVYVVDNSKFEETRQKLFEKIAPRSKLTNEEFNIVYTARAATLVPITEYKGGYKEPIVLINRELEFDEVDWITSLEDN